MTSRDFFGERVHIYVDPFLSLVEPTKVESKHSTDSIKSALPLTGPFMRDYSGDIVEAGMLWKRSAILLFNVHR